jgi:predicted Zn-dependent peptidase
VFYERTVLPGGVTVITESIPTVRSVALGIWVAAGSRDELAEEAGISHFLEHMMFKGTTTRSAQDISEGFERLGARFNAFTSEETTCYYCRVIDRHASDAFDILADMVVNSTFDEDAAVRERQVVLEEISRMEDTPDSKVDELFTQALFAGHPLGLSVIGRTETVSGFLPKDLRSYTTRHYRTGDIVVAAAGNVEHAEVVKMAEEGLVGLSQGTRAERALSAPTPERRVSVATKKELEQAHICWGTIALPAGHPDRFAMDLLNAVFGGGMASRLFTEVREKRGLVYAVHSYLSPHVETGALAVYAGTGPENTAEVIRLITVEADKILADGITADELSRAKDSVDGALVLNLENTSGRMMRLGGSELSNVELFSIDELLDRYSAVTLEDVSRVAQATLGGPRTLAVVGPHAEADIDVLLA